MTTKLLARLRWLLRSPPLPAFLLLRPPLLSVGDKIKRRLATNVNVTAISVPPATSTTTTDTTAGVSLQVSPNEHPTPGEGFFTRSSLSALSTSVATLSSLLLEDVHDLPPASTSISTDPPSDDKDGFTLVTKGKKSRPRKMTEASENATHSEERTNPTPRTTKTAVVVSLPHPLPNVYPAFRVPAQEGY